MSKKTVIVCLCLLFCGSAFGEEPCEAPTASDYSNASQELIDSPQGSFENLANWGTISSRAKIKRYEQCLKQQEANLRRERLKAEAEVLRAETEAIKAETEALKNDARKPSTRKLSGDADYQIDLGLVLDFEDTRKLIEQCTHLGRLEVIRGPLESATDLEQLRATLESYGIVDFYGCPSGVTGSGIVELLEEYSPDTIDLRPKAETPKPRVFSEEDFADAPLEKEPERIIDGELYEARARNRTLGGSWYRVEVEFDGDEIIVHFTRHGLGRVHLTLDDEKIDDPSDIDARDRASGNWWILDVDGLSE